MKNSITKIFDQNGFTLLVQMQPILTVLSLQPTTHAQQYQRAVNESRALREGSSKFAPAQEKFNLLTINI